jgi:hypothetical protein
MAETVVLPNITSTVANGQNTSGELPLHERPVVYNWKTTNEAGYTIDETPSGTGRPLRVICVGAGASGINLAKFVQDRLKDVHLKIYEKNDDVGGTWLENRYPYVFSLPCRIMSC